MNTQPEFTFHPSLILRTPRNPISSNVSEEDIYNSLNDAAFLESIYLASPVLHKECIKWKSGQLTDKKEINKLVYSLAKYKSRMGSRCTPFGMFSGCGVVNWGEGKSEIVLETDGLQRHTRLDMHYLCALAQKLAQQPYIKPHLKYFPNNSLYNISDEARYVEYKFVDGKRAHQISAVTSSAYVKELLAMSKQGAYLHQLAGSLTGEDIAYEDAANFVEQLISSQLLVSELEPAITGKEFIYQIIKVLQSVQAGHPDENLNNIIVVLNLIEAKLAHIDQAVTNEADAYKEIIGLIERLSVSFEESKLFQTDIIRKPLAGKVNQALQSDIMEAFTLLNAMYTEKENPNMASFAKRFYERYEDRQMPLLEVLDTEAGIGYLDMSSQTLAPLIDGLVLPAQSGNQKFAVNFNKTLVWLFDKLKDSAQEGAYEVLLDKNELKDASVNWDDLAPSMSVMFRLVGDQDDQVLIENIGGSSAANLLGRFAHADEAINSTVNDITKAEQDINPDVLFAEIVHLPESRVGNILLHPAFRKYEIPYLGQSSLPDEFQIHAQDLLVSVRNQKVILTSKRLGKQILPRLSTAHNFSFRALPVYQFLCDLQSQHIRAGFAFNWGAIANQYKFLPRVKYRNAILSLAQWKLTKDDLQEVISANDERLADAIATLRSRWSMPRYITLADGDNELLIDFDNHLTVKSWLQTIKNRGAVKLKEFIFSQSGPVVSEKGEVFINQFVASLIKTKPVYQTPVANKTPSLPVANAPQRKFNPGSEWLYYKVYCGPTSADKILSECIVPLVESLKAQGLIDKWFFIRYNDPHYHLRIRFHVTEQQAIAQVMGAMLYHTQTLEQENCIWKVQIDAYQRELERYGASAIELAEEIFHKDSESLLHFLSLTEGDEREELRWLWGLRAMDALLDRFKLSLTEKHQLLTSLKESFAKEFNSDKNLKTQINKKYAQKRHSINQLLSQDNDPLNPYHELIKAIDGQSINIQSAADQILLLSEQGALEIGISHLLGSYIHMLLNRLFVSQPRAHEMVIYDLLSHYYQSALAQQKQKLAVVTL